MTVQKIFLATAMVIRPMHDFAGGEYIMGSSMSCQPSSFSPIIFILLIIFHGIFILTLLWRYFVRWSICLIEISLVVNKLDSWQVRRKAPRVGKLKDKRGSKD